jgi:hypothetical protein
MTLRIEFEEQVWAQIINMLAEMPYKQSGAIINTMATQIQAQRPPEGQMVASKPNGGDRNSLRE